MTDIFWMKRALLFANRALLLNKIPVGAVLVYNNIEIGSAFNYSGFTFCSFYHAEFISLNQGSFYISNYLFDNVTLYITLEPCFMCLSCVFFSKIKRVVFGGYNNKQSNIFVSRFFKNLFYLKGGLFQKESVILLKFFFLKNRLIFNNMSDLLFHEM